MNERGLRVDLIIALCALLISTIAASASWWQARVMQTQTEVLQEQLGAQVWPYVSITEGLTGDTARITISNDGLGPAILRSLAVFVDGVPRSSFTAMMHAILGPDIVKRTPHGQKIGFTIDSGSVGSVMRPGNDSLGFSLTSKRFAPALLQANRRVAFRICYCAIVPGKCWLLVTGVRSEPRSQASCPEIAGDLLHAPALNEILNRDF